MQQQWCNMNVKRATGFTSKTTRIMFLYISLPSLHNYDMKLPNFMLYKGCNQAISTFSFSVWTWIIWFSGIQLQESSPTFDKSNWDGIITIKILKNENSLFRRHFCCPCRPLILIISIYLYPCYWPFLGKISDNCWEAWDKQERNPLSRTSAGWCTVTNSFYLWAPVYKTCK